MRPIAPVHNALLKVVAMMQIQVPAADTAHAEVLPRHLGRLCVPDDLTAAAGVLVAHLDQGRCETVHSLPVHVDPLPGVGVLQVGIRLEDLLEEVALNGDPEVDLSQAGGYLVGRELELNGGEVSAAARRGIDEVRTRARQLDCLQD